jgi:hypothetical protein
MSSLSDVVVSDRLSDANQVRFLGTSNLSVSWELSRAGQLAFDIPRRDLAAYGFSNPLDLMSKWIRYEHPSAGPWGGIITNVAPANGVVSIGAESWAAALRGVGTRGGGGALFGLVGMLMQQIDRTASITGVTRGSIDVGGRDVLVEDDPVQSGQDIYESYLPSVLERWIEDRITTPRLQAAGWNVDPVTRRLSFDGTYGTDRSTSISIRSGRQVTSADLSDDATDIVNTVIINGKVNYTWTETVKSRGKRGKRRTRRITHTGVKNESVVGVDAASVARHGEKAVVFREDAPSTASMQARANSRARTLTLDTVNASIATADIDDLWMTLREGDLVHADLANEGVAGKMVIRIRALDVGSGVMTYAGEVLPS